MSTAVERNTTVPEHDEPTLKIVMPGTCPHCGGTKTEPNQRQHSGLYPAGEKCLSKFHLQIPDITWDEFLAQRNRKKITVLPDPKPAAKVTIVEPKPATKKTATRSATPKTPTVSEPLPDIILYLQHIHAIVEADEASRLSGISAKTLSRGKDPAVNSVAVLRLKRRKFFFVDTLK